MTTSTIVTALTVHTPDSITHRNDVPVRLERASIRHLTLEFTTVDLGVTVRLTDAERIAFIELLGGKDAA